MYEYFSTWVLYLPPDLGASQGYQDIVNEKIASAIAKLEEAGLTPEACEKFLKTYGKVIDCQLSQQFPPLFRCSTPTMPTCWTSSTPT